MTNENDDATIWEAEIEWGTGVSVCSYVCIKETLLWFSPLTVTVWHSEHGVSPRESFLSQRTLKKTGNDFGSHRSGEEDQAFWLFEEPFTSHSEVPRRYQKMAWKQTQNTHTRSYTWALFKRDYSASCQLGTIEAEIPGWQREGGPAWTHLATPLHRVGFSSLWWLQVISGFYLDTLSFAFTCSCFVTRFKDDRAGPVPQAARNRLPVLEAINEVNLPPKGDVSKVLVSQLTCKIQWMDHPYT